MNRNADPVNAGVAANDLVHRIDHDHFVVFVDGVLREIKIAGSYRSEQ